MRSSQFIDPQPDSKTGGTHNILKLAFNWVLNSVHGNLTVDPDTRWGLSRSRAIWQERKVWAEKPQGQCILRLTWCLCSMYSMYCNAQITLETYGYLWGSIHMNESHTVKIPVSTAGHRHTGHVNRISCHGYVVLFPAITNTVLLGIIHYH